MNKSTLEKKKLQAQKKALIYYRKVVNTIMERSERTLNSYPDSKVATDNKKDCEAALKAEKSIYVSAQLDATKLPRGQATFEEGE